jgi:hypothetical protein
MKGEEVSPVPLGQVMRRRSFAARVARALIILGCAAMLLAIGLFALRRQRRVATWTSMRSQVAASKEVADWDVWIGSFDESTDVLAKGGTVRLSESRFLMTGHVGGWWWGDDWAPDLCRYVRRLPSGDWVMIDLGSGALPLSDLPALPQERVEDAWVLVSAGERVQILSMATSRRFVFQR